ncbi:MAG: hypothetical protein HY335_04560, partial [Deinococcus sp.]|nr:hypothetical protein [Deinococcus sp.]
LVGLLALAGAVVVLARSGNFSLIPVAGLEERLRGLLDTILIARPRFKELVGHPLLVLGLTWRWPVPGKLLLLTAGLLGQVSLVNTFSHYHTPLVMSLIRTGHGVWMGVLLGLAAGWLLRRAGLGLSPERVG